MIALIDYNMGNLGSVLKALEYANGDVRIVDNPSDLDKFSGCMLPGVGNFGDGMEELNSRGFVKPLRDFIHSGKAFTGICLGMQMLMDSSEEAPGVAGLGVIPGKVLRFPSGSAKVPHMGWNSVRKLREVAGAESVADDDYFYFVHSYYVLPENPFDTVLECDYILPFAAAIGRENIFATQFHPEKSQNNGLKLLEQFVKRAEAK